MNAKTIIVGNLGNDPERKGSALKLNIATNRRWKDKNGDLQEETTWYNTVCFGKLADNIENIAKKGQTVYAEGYIRTNEHEGKQYWSLVAERILVMK